jgi:hypothetical protein
VTPARADAINAAPGQQEIGMSSQRHCYRCGNSLAVHERIGRRDTCLHCGADLHCCRNCGHYTPVAHNQCREPMSERQVEKEAGNFCEYFSFRSDAADSGRSAADQQARHALAALFAKKAAE